MSLNNRGFVVVVEGAAVQSGRLPSLGFISAHPIGARYPNMHLWCQKDFWISGSNLFLHTAWFWLSVCKCVWKLSPIKLQFVFVFVQVMPQLLNSLSVDSTGLSIDWGTLVVYSCSVSCDTQVQYCPEFIWKQDFNVDQHTEIKPTVWP